MARQVYFDPFGSYTRGFDQGAQRQMGLEDSVRRARAQDYDFNTLQPYRTAAIQRQDQLDTRAQPYKINMLPIGYQNALTNEQMQKFNLATRGAQTFGIADPLLDIGRRAFGLQFATTGDPNAGYSTTIYGRGPDGQLSPIASRPNYMQQVLDNGANFERNLQLEQLRNQALLYGARGQYYMGDSIARQQQAQAALFRAQNAANPPPAYMPSGVDFTGFGVAPGAGVYPGYDPANDYNLPNQ